MAIWRLSQEQYYREAILWKRMLASFPQSLWCRRSLTWCSLLVLLGLTLVPIRADDVMGIGPWSGSSLPVRAQGTTSPQAVLMIPPLTEVIVDTIHTLTFQLTDADGMPIPESGILVLVDINAPPPRREDSLPASVDPRVIITNANGQGTTNLTVGHTSGSLQLLVTVGDVETVFVLTALPDRDSARLVEVSGNNQVGNQGEELGEPLVVRLEDQFGNPLSGEEVMGEIIQGVAGFVPATPPGMALRELTLLSSQMESGKECDPEPTDMMIEYGDVIICEIGDTGPPPDITTTIVMTDARGEARFFLRLGASTDNIVTLVSFIEQEIRFETRVAIGDSDLFRFFGEQGDTIQLTLTRRIGGAMSVDIVLSGPASALRLGEFKMIGRIHVEQEVTCPRGFGRFADFGRGEHQTIQTAQKTPVTFVFPPELLRAIPAIGPAAIQTPMVAGAEEGIGGNDIVRQQ